MPPSPGYRCESSTTAMPCGQKKKTREISQSQTVIPPLAEIEGTTLRLTIATTKSKTRSQRPRTRLRCAVSVCGSVGISHMPRGIRARGPLRTNLYGAAEAVPLQNRPLVRRDGDRLLFLGLRQGRSDFSEDLEVHRDVFLGVLHRDGPLLVPPVGLRHDAAIDHGEPIVLPQFGVDFQPVA